MGNLSQRQRFVFLLGIGMFGAAWWYYKKNNTVTTAVTNTDNSYSFLPDFSGGFSPVAFNPSGAIMKIWDSIPANPFTGLIAKTESAFGLPSTLLARIAWIESRFNPNAHNASGATGIMQIVPAAHPGVNASDPNEAIPYAAKYLKSLYNMFGSWDKAIVAYNWGQGNLQKAISAYGNVNWKYHIPSESANYLAQVQAVIDLPPGAKTTMI